MGAAIDVGLLLSPDQYRAEVKGRGCGFLEAGVKLTCQAAGWTPCLGEQAEQFAAFLTLAALEQCDGYIAADWRTALAALPREALQESAQTLAQALESAGDQREEYWKNRIQPFWHEVWPKSGDLATPRMAEFLARMCIAAGSRFPEALETVSAWLKPVEHYAYLVHRLNESELCRRYPAEALSLLTAVVSELPWPSLTLGKCLQAIEVARPDLASDGGYKRLRELYRRHEA